MEERIAQLENQVAALQAQVSQLLSTETPSGYYMSKYSGEEIDTLLEKVAALP